MRISTTNKTSLKRNKLYTTQKGERNRDLFFLIRNESITKRLMNVSPPSSRISKQPRLGCSKERKNYAKEKICYQAQCEQSWFNTALNGEHIQLQ